MKLRTAIAITLCTSGCSGDPAATVFDPNLEADTASASVGPGDTFRLAPGDFVVVGDGSLRVGFREVQGDSRCPIDVVCVWQGDVAAVVGTAVDGERWNWATLHTGVQPHEVVVDDFIVRLLLVEPSPISTEPIDPEDYRVVLTVEEA